MLEPHRKNLDQSTFTITFSLRVYMALPLRSRKKKNESDYINFKQNITHFKTEQVRIVDATENNVISSLHSLCFLL